LAVSLSAVSVLLIIEVPPEQLHEQR